MKKGGTGTQMLINHKTLPTKKKRKKKRTLMLIKGSLCVLTPVSFPWKLENLKFPLSSQTNDKLMGILRCSLIIFLVLTIKIFVS